MSIYTKLILPLIDKQLEVKDISKETGFVDAYTLDINRPYLTSHVFLLYKRIATNEHFDILNKLSKLNTLYNKKYIKINNISYVLFCFIINSAIRKIRKNCLISLTKDEKIRICNFWKYTDCDITDYLLGYYYFKDEFKDDIVPEEDFNPKDFLTYDKKRGGLVLSSPL